MFSRWQFTNIQPPTVLTTNYALLYVAAICRRYSEDFNDSYSFMWIDLMVCFSIPTFLIPGNCDNPSIRTYFK